MTASTATATPAVETAPKPYIGWTVALTSTYLGDGDSSFYTIYFDAERGTFERYCTGYDPAGKVDAPEDVQEAWAAEQEAVRATQRAARMRRAIQDQIAHEARQAALPTSGKIVEVVKGRTVPKGTRGMVMRRTEGQWGMRLWIEAEGTQERFWISEDNVQVIAQQG